MKDFVELYDALDGSTKTSIKHGALVKYFQRAIAEGRQSDAAWMLALFTGKKIKRAVGSGKLRQWASEVSGVPGWLIDECYAAVGDLGETLSLVVPGGESKIDGAELSLTEVVERKIKVMAKGDDATRKKIMQEMWGRLDQRGRFVFHKLLSGTFRVGVSRGGVIKALAEVAKVDVGEIELRLSGDWQVSGEFFDGLTRGESNAGGKGGRSVQPYPFFLAHQLPDEQSRPGFSIDEIGQIDQWQAEWKWDGMRAQVVRRAGVCAIWSRGQELVSEQFAEIADACLEGFADGTVLDGEILAWEGSFESGHVGGFASLQRRITRKQQTGMLFVDVPVVFMAYDVLEDQGVDVRSLPMGVRRARLEGLVERARASVVKISPLVRCSSWAELEAKRQESRKRGVEGLMLKQRDSVYGSGRRVVASTNSWSDTAWWKWKIDPYTVDCVLIAAQRGSGRRASMYTDFTFGVWSGPQRGQGELVSFAKAYHGKGMTDEVFTEIDQWIREHTIGRVQGAGIRLVEPGLVFELAFEGIMPSGRHRSGVALRFPRIHRWRKDKKADEADTLEFVRGFLRAATPKRAGQGEER